MADDHSLLDRTLSLVKEKNNTITQLNEKITKIEISQKDQSKEQKDLDKKKTVLKKSTEKIHATINQVREVLRTEQEKESALSIEIHRGKSKLESLESQAYFYQELVEQKDGYPEGVRTILKSPNDYPGIIGTVGELFQIEEKYDVAFQSALGDWTKCLVAEDRNAAVNIVELAQSHKIGNMSILPLKELNKLSYSLSMIGKEKRLSLERSYWRDNDRNSRSRLCWWSY